MLEVLHSVDPVWEEGLVDFEQRAFIVDEEVEDVRLVAPSELIKFDLVLGKLCQLKQALFKLFCLLRILLKFLKLFPVLDLIFQAAFHDVFSHFFDAIDEE